MSEDNNPAPQRWTVLIYMAADNNLSDRCVDDLREMKMAGLKGQVTVKVQADRASELGNRPARYTIQGCPREGWGDSTWSLDNDKEDWSKQYNTGRKEPLLDFIRWGIEGHENDKLMLVLWGHASPLDRVPVPERPERPFRGRRRWSGRGLNTREDSPAFFQFCPDDFTHDGLTDIELKEVLQELTGRLGRSIDILGLDACLMSMVELSYEMREYVKYIVASQSVIPSTSWPYHWILAALGSQPFMSAKDLCETIVKKYITYYADYDDVPVQLSACDLSRCDHIKRALGNLAEKLIAGLEANDLVLRNAVLSAHFRSQPYYKEQYYDLYDFCYMLRESCGQSYPEVKDACHQLMKELNDGQRSPFVVYSEYNFNPGHETDLQFSYGTSIYFPWDTISDRYEYLDFAKDSKWGDFLKLYSNQISKFDRASRPLIAAAEQAHAAG